MDESTIKALLDELASEEKIFANEQDFQFELANKLNALEEVEEVKLEALSVESQNKKWEEVWQDVRKNVGEGKCGKIKEYTDILVKTKNEWIAIELKYKMPSKPCFYETSRGKIVTQAQGAYDYGCYYFLSDIKRLEQISNNSFALSPDIKVQKSFAILLTNDKNYRYNDFSKSAIWRNYSLCNGRHIDDGKLLFREQDPSYNKFEAIELGDSYCFEWHDYPLPSTCITSKKRGSVNPPFSFLVVPVYSDNNLGDKFAGYKKH